MPKRTRIEFETLAKLDFHLAAGMSLDGAVFQDLDLRDYTPQLLETSLRNAVFLGCRLTPALLDHARDHSALFFPDIPGTPYSLYRPELYSVHTLLDGYQPGVPGTYERTTDGRIYDHFAKTGGPRPRNIVEALGRRLHDHAISDALEEVIENRRVVAIMGGHGMSRAEDRYLTVARIARSLTREGFLLASGGGPGAMEATNLGAFFANHPESALLEACCMLAAAPLYLPRDPWLDAAFLVLREFGTARHVPPGESIGIPTWHYGHEPPNIFASHIAKYFENSVREDGLVTIANAGILFAPGSAGTIQEAFQDAAQNHYETLGFASPMIFLDASYWTETLPVAPLIQQLSQGRPYASWLRFTDSPDEAMEVIRAFSARQLPRLT